MVVDTCQIDPARLGRQGDFRKARQVQVEMLDALAAFCEAHGLTYYLSGGTLLGAVRHKGYIPWDDDIDVNMPRPDVDKLIALAQGRLNDHMEIASPFGPVPHAAGFPRLCDKRYILHSSTSDKKSSYYTNLFIDIFPIEGLPTDLKKVRWHYRLAKSMVTMRKLAYFEGVSGKKSKWKTMRQMARPLAKLMGVDFWNRRLLSIAQKYRYEDCPYVGVVTSCFHTMEEYIEREGYGTPVKVTFEGKEYNAPAQWDKYLTNLYGDYMQLPPEDQRGNHHHFEVYESKEQ